MGFHTGAYATVWEITETGSKFSKIRISTSRKDKESDEYVTDFNGFVSMVGDSKQKHQSDLRCAGGWWPLPHQDRFL